MPIQPSPGAGYGGGFRESELENVLDDSLPDQAETTSDCAVTNQAADYPVVAPQNAFINGTITPSETGQQAAFQEISAALGYGLELVRYGAMLVADEGRLRVANRAALSILKKKDGLWLSNPGLVAERASDTRLLLRLLHEAIHAPEPGELKESPILLPRKFARTSLIVRVFPGPALKCWPDGARRRDAMLMLYDQDMELDVNITVLIRLYGLTRGEASLAAALMRGKSIEEAAEELFISPHTARTHLKRIFMKTDTHRQSELVVRGLLAVL
jgi:DNA-binding CsgD family transcriptional regulator